MYYQSVLIFQVNVSIRWVDARFEVHEDPVELIETTDTTGETLAAILKDLMIRMQLPLKNCRGQAYDGAANMAGKNKGVAARIQRENPAALHVHCLAHCTNLVLQEASRRCRMVRDALDITNELTCMVRNSPKMASLLISLSLTSGSSGKGAKLKPLCPTRWTCRTSSLRSVLSNHVAVLDTLEEFSASSGGEPARRASGMLATMERFATVIGLHISLAVFSVAENLSRTLQCSTATAQVNVSTFIFIIILFQKVKRFQDLHKQ